MKTATDRIVKDCCSIDETESFAAEFATRLTAGSWVGLIGPLGAGKSVFARVIGRAFGVTDAMPSPTYNLMLSYDALCPVYHLDLYRISSPDEAVFADLASCFAGGGICLVEWADKVKSIWPETGWLVTIQIESENSRRLLVESFDRARESDRGDA